MIARRLLVPLLVLLIRLDGLTAEAPLLDRVGDPLPLRAVARLGSSRLRQGGSIYGLTFSPEGKRLASWGGRHRDYELAIWEVASGKELRRIKRPGDRLDAWAWVRDGRLLAVLESAADERTRSLLDLAAVHAEPTVLPARDDGDDARFAISPTGNLLAVSRFGGAGGGYWLEFRDLSRAGANRGVEAGRAALGPLQYATILRFTPDASTLVAYSPPQGEPRDPHWTAVVWDVATAAVRRRLTLPETAFGGLGQNDSISNEQIAIGLVDGSVRVYDLKSGSEQKITAHLPEPEALNRMIGTLSEFNGGGSMLVTAGADRTIRFWDSTHGMKIREITWKQSRPELMAVSPDGRTLAVAGAEGVIHLLDATTGAELFPQPGHQNAILVLTASADGRLVATAGRDRTLRIWQLDNASEVRVIACEGSLKDCAFAPDSKSVLAAVLHDADPDHAVLQLWNAIDGKELLGSVVAGSRASVVRFTADGTRLVSLADGFVGIRDWPRGMSLREIALPGGDLPPVGTFLAVSPDGKLVLTMTRHVNVSRGMILDAAGGSLDLWEAASGKHSRQLAAGDSTSFRGVFTTTGELIVSDDRAVVDDKNLPDAQRGVLQVLDVPSGRPKRSFATPDFVSALALAPDGRTALLGSREGTISAVDVTSGRVREVFSGHHGWITGLVALPGGKRLVSSSIDGSALIWELSIPSGNAP
jgi:WD40 repeat protein